MRSMLRFIVILIIILAVIFGLNIVREISAIEYIKEKVAELEDVTNFYQERSEGLTDINNIDKDNVLIYKTGNNISVWEQNDKKIVLYDGKEYTFNEEGKYYYESNTSEFEQYDLTSASLPGGFSFDDSIWDLVTNLDVKTKYFKNENCYVFTYEKDEVKYSSYIRQKDGLCIATSEEKDGTTIYNYYKTEINTQKDLTYESVFKGYDKVVITRFEKPYVERANGTKEYVDLK